MNRVELAVSCFEEGYTCSQVLLSTYGAKFGLDCEIALRIADGFGGWNGMAYSTYGR